MEIEDQEREIQLHREPIIYSTGSQYTAGNGIDINDENVISVDTDVVQEKLTAGDNITIEDNVISATNTEYTAGSNISITDGVISASVPTVNDATLTITQNEINKGTFTANDADDTTIALTDTTYTAGTNVSISEQNVISATDTTYNNFVGTDGIVAGTAGLVPAPLVADLDKYLKSDGTWGAISAGYKQLTSADYNWNSTAQDAVTTPFDCVATWLLPSGGYTIAADTVVRTSKTNALLDVAQCTLLVGYGTGSTEIIVLYGPGGMPRVYYTATTSGASTSSNSGEELISASRVQQSVGTSSINLMSQSAITNMVFNGQNRRKVQIGANTNTNGDDSVAVGRYARVNNNAHYGIALGAFSDVTSKGEINVGTSRSSQIGITGAGYNNTDYRLITGVHDPVSDHDAATKGYVDTVAGGGGSGDQSIKVLTEDDYNYDWGGGGLVNNCVALWLLPTGFYTVRDTNVEVIADANNTNGLTFNLPPYHNALISVVSEESPDTTVYISITTEYAGMESFNVAYDDGTLDIDSILHTQVYGGPNTVGAEFGALRKGAGAPSDMLAFVGDLYVDITTFDLYVCVDSDYTTDPTAPTATWSLLAQLGN